MAKKTDTDKQKDKKPKKGNGDAQAPEPYTSIATHPRASLHVRKAKGWGGVAGFVIAALLSIKAHVTFLQTLERGLLFGIIGYLVLWALTMLVWRQLMLAEQHAAYQEVERRHAEAATQSPGGATPSSGPAEPAAARTGTGS